MSCGRGFSSNFGPGCGGNWKANFYTPTIPAGELRNRITIQYPTLIQDDIGGGTYTWTDLKTVWAGIKTVAPGGTTRNIISARYNEHFQQDQLREVDYYTITMRFDNSINTKMRVVYKTRIFQILAVINTDEFDVITTLSCREWG